MRLAILTISDSRHAKNDVSGDTLYSRAKKHQHNIIHRAIVQDERQAIIDILRLWCNDDNVDAIMTTGGTGLTARDVTPEAVRSILDKEIEGFGEMFRMLSYEKIKTSTIQSRCLAGVCQGTYIFALPGSPSACRDAWDMLLAYQLDPKTKPCNLADIHHRL
ncbi:MAG: molybdenum cofactor biosynthesis protein [Alphaproteobacteria bacterium GM7ARS4]|nr:molybdenum cofactor biosynthesis protein [Alphaproteobacteria bacterium GM7ARS4]